MIICGLTKVDWKPSLSLSLSLSLLVRSHPSLAIIVGLISRRVVSLSSFGRVSSADAETRMLHLVRWSRSFSFVLVSKVRQKLSLDDHGEARMDLSRTLH